MDVNFHKYSQDCNLVLVEASFFINQRKISLFFDSLKVCNPSNRYKSHRHFSTYNTLLHSGVGMKRNKNEKYSNNSEHDLPSRCALCIPITFTPGHSNKARDNKFSK